MSVLLEFKSHYRNHRINHKMCLESQISFMFQGEMGI